VRAQAIAFDRPCPAHFTIAPRGGDEALAKTLPNRCGAWRGQRRGGP